MAGNNSLQILRSEDDSFNIEQRDEILKDGQPFYNKNNHSLYIGDGSTELKSLSSLYNLGIIDGDAGKNLVWQDNNNAENRNSVKDNAVFGSSNKFNGQRNIISGDGNSIEGENSNNNFVSGSNNILKNKNSCIVSGYYNSNNENTLLEIGNGSSDNDRKNAFEVLKDGRAKVQSAPTEENDIVRKKELDGVVDTVAEAQDDLNTLETGLDEGTFHVARAIGDENGNNILSTYATKEALNDVSNDLALLETEVSNTYLNKNNADYIKAPSTANPFLIRRANEYNKNLGVIAMETNPTYGTEHVNIISQMPSMTAFNNIDDRMTTARIGLNGQNGLVTIYSNGGTIKFPKGVSGTVALKSDAAASIAIEDDNAYAFRIGVEGDTGSEGYITFVLEE